MATRRIGRYTPAPTDRDIKPSKRAARIVDETIVLYGAKLHVSVHHAYPLREMRLKNVQVGPGREVTLEEQGIEASVSDHMVTVRLPSDPKKYRGVPYGAFAFELSKKALRKFPLLCSFDEDGSLIGVKIFRLDKKDRMKPKVKKPTRTRRGTRRGRPR